MEPIAAPEEKTVYTLSFTVSGSEYFLIWIVNIVLTILTLGIYSAWATVRTNQYLHNNLRLADASFGYHVQPITILIGRAIALALFVVYFFINESNPLVGTSLLMIGGLALAPWLIHRSLRFRLANTSYRGLRFGFDGTIAGSYKAFAMWPAVAVGIVILAMTILPGFMAMLSMLVVPALVPFMHYQIKRYQHNHSRFGKTRFSFHATPRDFYMAYGRWVLIVLAVVVLPAAVLGYSAFGGGDMNSALRGILPVILYAYAAMFAMGVTLTIMIRNLIWNHTALGPHTLVSRAPVLGFVGLQAINILAMIVTLGLFTPFAIVRTVRYLAEHSDMVVQGDVEAFMAGQRDDSVGAMGDETADIFGIDIAL